MIDNQERLINNLVIEMIIFPKCSSLCANHLHDCHSYLANCGVAQILKFVSKFRRTYVKNIIRGEQLLQTNC